MVFLTSFKGKHREVHLDRGIDLSLPLSFAASQANSFNAPHATSEVFQAEGFIGDTRLGGACNVTTLQITPHCNGTHTECVGHITHERITVGEVLKASFFTATLVSVHPCQGHETPEQYAPAKDPDDILITRAQLQQALAPYLAELGAALVIRTLPNDPSKQTRKWTTENSPFFSLEAMAWLSELPIEHLLVDMPSVDRLHDDGKLNVHRLFWGITPGSQERASSNKSNRTLTEFIYVPEGVMDGSYFLNLQTSPFVLDATPSRPILFPITSSK